MESIRKLWREMVLATTLTITLFSTGCASSQDLTTEPLLTVPVASPVTTSAPTLAPAPELTPEPEPVPIKFSDPALEDGMRRVLNIWDRDITSVDALGVTELDLSRDYRRASFGTFIYNVDGLQYFTNLKSLDLTNNAITDIYPLSELTKLEKLYLGGNGITSIEALSNLIKLRELSLAEIENLCDLSMLAQLPNLETLDLKNNSYDEDKFANLDVLWGLSSLQCLDLSYSYLPSTYDLRMITQLPNLKVLKLSGLNSSSDSNSNIFGILDDDLSKLTRLEELDISQNNNINNWEWIKNLKQLKKLNVSDCGTTRDVSFLDGLRSLQELDISDSYRKCFYRNFSAIANLNDLKSLKCNPATDEDYKILAGMTNLVELEIHIPEGDLIDISVLSEITHLTSLDIRTEKVLDISSLAQLTNLVKIELSANKLTGVKALTNLVSLQEASLYSWEGFEEGFLDVLSQLTKLETLSVGYVQPNNDTFSKMTNLKSLEIFDYTLDVSFLAYLPQLEYLYLGCDKMVHADSLENLQQLHKLTLDCESLKDISPLNSMKQLNELELWDVRLDDFSSLVDLPNLTKLSFCSDADWVVDLDSFDGFQNVEQVNITYGVKFTGAAGFSKITDVDLENVDSAVLVRDLTRARTITLRGEADIRDINALAQLTCLEELYLFSEQISDIRDFPELMNLTVLELYCDQITDISALARLTNLTKLGIYGSQITDISALAALTNLTELSISENKISDINALAGLTNLTILDLSYNPIMDINVLGGLTNLKRLKIIDTQVSNLDALIQLDNLEWIWVVAPLDREAIQRFKNARPGVDVWGGRLG